MTAHVTLPWRWAEDTDPVRQHAYQERTDLVACLTHSRGSAPVVLEAMPADGPSGIAGRAAAGGDIEGTAAAGGRDLDDDGQDIITAAMYVPLDVARSKRLESLSF